MTRKNRTEETRNKLKKNQNNGHKRTFTTKQASHSSRTEIS